MQSLMSVVFTVFDRFGDKGKNDLHQAKYAKLVDIWHFHITWVNFVRLTKNFLTHSKTSSLWVRHIKWPFFSQNALSTLSPCCSSMVIATPSLSFIQILRMGVKHAAELWSGMRSLVVIEMLLFKILPWLIRKWRK